MRTLLKELVDTAQTGWANSIVKPCAPIEMKKLIVVHKLMAPRTAEGKNDRVGICIVGNIQAAQKRWTVSGRVPSLDFFCTDRQWNQTYSPAAQKRAQAVKTNKGRCADAPSCGCCYISDDDAAHSVNALGRRFA